MEETAAPMPEFIRNTLIACLISIPLTYPARIIFHKWFIFWNGYMLEGYPGREITTGLIIKSYVSVFFGVYAWSFVIRFIWWIAF